jgi:predicted alpha/beta hydrolase
MLYADHWGPVASSVAGVETVPIELPDGAISPVQLFPTEAGHSISPDAPRPVVVILPGLGVPAGYYDRFAQSLADSGFDAAVGELRGQGDSRPKPSRDSRFGYHELVAVDLPAIMSTVRGRFPDSTPYLLGHSLGGQLAVMYAARARKVAGLILVASGIPYHRSYGRRAPLMLAASAVLGTTAWTAGVWPGDRVNIGGFGRQPGPLITDWARLARTGQLLPEGADIDYEERITRLTLPVLSVTVPGDSQMPPGAASQLLAKLPNAAITEWRSPQEQGHVGWIRDGDAISERIVEWLRDRG